ncbi:MAG: DUF1552 domain-containing protein [Bdellovibrionota bacterium]
MKKIYLDRRTFLRGLGTSIALPYLECMIPQQASAAVAGVPQRFVAIYMGLGMLTDWNSTGTETSWNLSAPLQPLLPYKNDISVIQGLNNDAGLVGVKLLPSSAHWQASTCYLTGQTYDIANRATRTALAGPGSSLDQMIAARTPNLKKSLIMGTHPNYLYPGGNSDRGSHGFLANVSWDNQTRISTRFVSSAQVFNYLFSSGLPTGQTTTQTLAQRAAEKKSILDDVISDINDLNARLGKNDKDKLNEFLTSVEETEKRVVAEGTVTVTTNTCVKPNVASYTSDTNTGGDGFVNPIINQRCRNMSDMLAIALQCDITRVSSFIFNIEHSYEDLFYYDTGFGSHLRHHDVSHHKVEVVDGGPRIELDVKRRAVNAFNTWQAQQLAYLLGKLKATPDRNSNLLENTLVMFGCGMSDPDAHSMYNIPMILAGRGAGHRSGRLIKLGGRNHSDFLATIANQFGAGSTVGLSKGTIANIFT